MATTKAKMTCRFLVEHPEVVGQTALLIANDASPNGLPMAITVEHASGQFEKDKTYTVTFEAAEPVS